MGKKRRIKESTFGKAGSMYLLWKAIPAVSTYLAKMFSFHSSWTNRSTERCGPEMVTLFGALLQAGNTSGGHLSSHSSQERPTAAISPGMSSASEEPFPLAYASRIDSSRVRVPSA